MPREDLIQVRRGTTAEWAAADPILDDGEPGQDTDTLEYKVGNGVDAWSVLPAINDTGIPSGPAGGALGGTYPNPPLSAAKQAEIDNAASAAAAAQGTANSAASAASAAQSTANAAVPKALYDANSLVIADTDDTPIVKVMGASTILARLASGGIVAATPAQIAALLPASGGAYAHPIDDPANWPATVGVADQEFNLGTFVTPITTLPSGISWFNQSTSTYSESLGAGQLTVPNGGLELRGFAASLSGAPATWDYYGKCEPAIDTGGAYIESGIVIRESSTGKAIQFGVVSQNQGGMQAMILSWSSNTSASFSVGPLTINLGSSWAYWRIRKNSATSYDYLVSRDGKSWFTILAGANPAFTPDQIGFGMSSNNAGVASTAIQWMRLR